MNYELRQVDMIPSLIKNEKYGNFNMYYYDKEKEKYNNNYELGLYRSVICNKNNDIECFSIPKSVNIQEFIKKYPEINKDIEVQEIVEGTMINVFYDKMTEEWIIATKKTIGANTIYFKENKKTYRTMFLEAMTYCRLSFNQLHIDYCYSFVLQHPENRIVVPFLYPNLFLIQIFKIYKEEDKTLVKGYFSHEIDFENELVMYPIRFHYFHNEPISMLFDTVTNHYSFVGYMIIHKKTGERTKIINPNYEYIKKLRNNIRDPFELFLNLHNHNKLNEYLIYFPEKFELFNSYYHYTNKVMVMLYQLYVDIFIYKNKSIDTFEEKIKYHLMKIHHFYKTKLRDSKQSININHIENYVYTISSFYLQNLF
jgi:hypothetical protein